VTPDLLQLTQFNRTPLTRLIVPAGATLLLLWIGGGILSAGLQITKANADRIAVTMCEVSQDCR